MRTILFLLITLLNMEYAMGQNANKKEEIETVEALLKQGDSLKSTDTDAALSTFQKGLAIALDNHLNAQASTLHKKIGVLHHINKNLDKAEEAYRKGIFLDSLSNNAADLYYNISLIKTAGNQQDSALFFLDQSLKLYEKFNLDASAYNAYLTAASAYKDRQVFQVALNYAIKAYNGFKEYNNLKKMADATTVIGNIQNQLKNYNQAAAYHLESLKLSHEIKNDYRTGTAHINLGNVYKSLKLPDSAASNYKKALAYFDENSSQYAVLFYNLAEIYKISGDDNSAEHYYKASVEANQALKDTVALSYNYNGLASLYLQQGKLKQVRYYLDALSAILLSATDRRVELSFYENQSEYNKKIGNYIAALSYQEQYSKLYQEIYNAEQAEIVQSLQAKFDFEKSENEILRLTLANKDSQLQLVEKNKAISKKNITLLVLALVIILSLVGHYLFIQKQKVKTQKLKIEKLEAIYQGQEIIKKRIARDLHDIITTNFDGLRLRVLALKRTDKLNDMVDGITTDLKSMNQQIRVVSHRLYPLEMYMGQQKFTDIIKSRLSEFQLYGNIFVELENQLPELLNQLDLVVQNNFYGILLEVLNNVEKHAMATKISIDNYLGRKNHLHFIFKDNGMGIENNHKEGIGLLNIKQRVEILEGACEIKKIESGTLVHISFPIKKMNE